MPLIPEHVVHKEIKKNLLEIGWHDGNNELNIEEYSYLNEYSGLKDYIGYFIHWKILKNKVKELNKEFFTELTQEEEHKAFEELLERLRSVDEAQMLEYIKHGVTLTLRGRYDRVCLIDFENLSNNYFFFVHELMFPGRPIDIRPDFTLFVNGIPIAIIEAKGKGIIELENIDWKRWAKVQGTEEEALSQIRTRYEKYCPDLFRFVQVGVAYGDKQVYIPTMPNGVKDAQPVEWRYPNEDISNIFDLLRPERFFEIIKYYTFFFKNKKGERIKIVGRYQQYKAVKSVIERIENYLSRKDNRKNGLIWHWQGSGKTLTMFFTANWFLNNYKHKYPVVFFVVDRKNLETQHVDNVFKAVEDREFKGYFERIENMDKLREVVENLIESEENKKIIPTRLYITTIQKFQLKKFKDLINIQPKNKTETYKAKRTVKKREVLFLIDEAHRTQYGTLAAVMRALFPHAMFYGFTGTPLFKNDRNTAEAFAYPQYGEFFLDVYFIRHSIRDGFTLDITCEVVEEKDITLKLTPQRLKAFEEAYLHNLPEDVEAFFEGRRKTLNIRRELLEELRETKVFLENPKNIERFAEYIAKRIYDDTMGFKFKAMVVAVNRVGCIRFKKALDKAFKDYFCSKAEEHKKKGNHDLAKHFEELCHNAERISEVVMTYKTGGSVEETEEFKEFLERIKSRREFQGMGNRKINETIVEMFREKECPKVLIVTDMLITGFDAPILRVMYLYKPLFEHKLLQTVARVNRPYPEKEFGLIVDGVGLLNELIKIKKVYELLAHQDEKVIHDFQRNFATSVKDKVKEFVTMLEKVKKDLIRFKIDIEALKEDIVNNNWEKVDQKMRDIREILSSIALDFKANEPNAVRLFNNLRDVISLYRALGGHPARLDYMDDMRAISFIYSTFMRLTGRVLKKNKFWEDLLNFVHQHMEVGPIHKVFSGKLSELSGTETSYETVAKFYELYSRAEDNAHEPLYKIILERLNQLLYEWLNRNRDLKEIAKEIKTIENQEMEFKKRVAGKSRQEKLIESVKFALENTLRIKDAELKNFREALRKVRIYTPSVVDELSAALLEDLMPIRPKTIPLQNLSKEVDRIVAEYIVPELKRYVREDAKAS